MKTLLLTLLLSASWIGVAPAADEAPKGLLYWFPFDEGQGARVVDSKGGVAGVIRGLGEKVKWVPGKTGSALEFIRPPGVTSGSEAFGCVDFQAPGSQFAEGFTVEAWVCPTVQGLSVPNCAEIITNARGDRGPGFRLRLTGSQLNFLSGNGQEYWGPPAWGPLVQNTWSHVAGTWDKSIFRAYLNGKLVGTSKENLLMPEGKNIITIGAYATGYAYGFDGLIDEVKVYSAALTPEEILKAATKP